MRVLWGGSVAQKKAAAAASVVGSVKEEERRRGPGIFCTAAKPGHGHPSQHVAPPFTHTGAGPWSIVPGCCWSLAVALAVPPPPPTRRPAPVPIDCTRGTLQPWRHASPVQSMRRPTD